VTYCYVAQSDNYVYRTHYELNSAQRGDFLTWRKQLFRVLKYANVLELVRFEDVWGIYGKMGKPIPSTKPHIYIKVRDRYIYISTLEHPT